MAEFTINAMLEMQRTLQERIKINENLFVQRLEKNKFLWMIGKIGEVIDIVKKNDAEKACWDVVLIRELIEEMVDVLMYYNDVMFCYGIASYELSMAYRKKFKRNMDRWYLNTNAAFENNQKIIYDL